MKTSKNSAITSKRRISRLGPHNKFSKEKRPSVSSKQLNFQFEKFDYNQKPKPPYIIDDELPPARIFNKSEKEKFQENLLDQHKILEERVGLKSPKSLKINQDGINIDQMKQTFFGKRKPTLDEKVDILLEKLKAAEVAAKFLNDKREINSKQNK